MLSYFKEEKGLIPNRKIGSLLFVLCKVNTQVTKTLFPMILATLSGTS